MCGRGASLLMLACACTPSAPAPAPAPSATPAPLQGQPQVDGTGVQAGREATIANSDQRLAGPLVGVRLPRALPEEIRWQPAQPAELRQAEAVELDVIAAEGRSVTLSAPFAGKLGRAKLGWPRAGAALGPTDVALLLWAEAPVPRHAVLAPWRPQPIEGGGADLRVLELVPGDRWVEAVLAAPGARVVVGTPLLRVLADGDLEVRLRLSAGDLRRLGDLNGADLLLPESERGPLVLTPRQDRMAGGATLRAALPLGAAGPRGGWPGDRRAAFLRYGQAERVLAIPREACVSRGVESFIWRRDRSGAYWRTEVVFGRDGGDRVAVERGLDAGDAVVTEGHALVEAAWARHRRDGALEGPQP